MDRYRVLMKGNASHIIKFFPLPVDSSFKLMKYQGITDNGFAEILLATWLVLMQACSYFQRFVNELAERGQYCYLFSFEYNVMRINININDRSINEVCNYKLLEIAVYIHTECCSYPSKNKSQQGMVSHGEGVLEPDTLRLAYFTNVHVSII